jgi:tetratricopeptide (TPR) repeat protein
MMNKVRAFVGHSFSKDDETLNKTFLDYLDQIKAMEIGFIWDHAKAAEPRQLAEKVMSLIRDRNLFIGICTKKERVIGPNELERCWIKRRVLGGHESMFSWKTSDWIIQEIGLAMGREMDLILLLEEGLRLPGGLQGDIEYIEFTRENPERSFGKLLEMIRSLIPKTVSASIEDLGTASSEKATQEQSEEEFDHRWLEPKPDWDHSDYEFALFHCIATGDLDVEKKITETFLKSPEGRTLSGPAGWEAICQYFRLVSGKDASIVKMEQLAEEKSEFEKVHFYLGKAYEIYKEYEKAGQAYVCAAERATDIRDKLKNFGEAAKAYFRAGIKVKSQEFAARMRQEVSQSGVGEEILVAVLRKIASIELDMDVYYALSERLLELKPGDTEIRFDLAYKYSENEEQELSLFHYLRIPAPRRVGITWNNLGVQRAHFRMVGSAVDSYRKAEQMRETLAMSNIANKFIGAGFLSEAEVICNKALEIKDYHKNIIHSMTRIKEIPTEEAEKEDSIVENAAPYSDFYRAYGKALCRVDPIDCSGIWEGPKCSLRLEIQGSRFLAEGTYELPESTLRALALQRAQGVGAPPGSPEKRVVRYEGTLSGHAIKAFMTEDSENQRPGSIANTLLTIGLPNKKEQTVLMAILDPFSEIRVYDKSAEVPQKLYVLRKLRDGG